MYAMKDSRQEETPAGFPAYSTLPLEVGSSIGINIYAHNPTSPSRIIQDKPKSILDSYKSIQLPFHHKHYNTLLSNLTPPSQLRKRSGGGNKQLCAQNLAVMNGKAGEHKYVKGKKRKTKDSPDVFDHLTMLHRKQQRYDGERTSQEVPLSPQMETSSNDFLSMHLTPRKRADEEEEDEKEDKQVLSRLAARKALYSPGQFLEEEAGIRSDAAGTWKRRGWSPESSSSLLVREGGNSLEFKTSRAVPILSMERVGPNKGQLQLSQVPGVTAPGPVFQDKFQGPSHSCSSFHLPVSMESLLDQSGRQCSRERSLVDIRTFNIHIPREE